MSFYESWKWEQLLQLFMWCIIINNSLSDKILGFTIDNNLDFSDHISNIYKIANQNLNALFKVSANMNSDNCSLLINSYFKSHFSDWLLVWMFCNLKNIKEVNKIRQRCLLLKTNN